ncbi:Syntaxin-1A [Phytophthora citrophthora]|uniref:Syntaxin-1A n=1 Tax=Phytophthora citrophthora TaxID=4793 RepID=A0AAD9H004_9STRA|nr:Syntaxin-1A [Phytophthora citrophthora]
MSRRGVVRPKFMEVFFKDVEEMQLDLANIRQEKTFFLKYPDISLILASQQISELNGKAILATSNVEEQAISTELGFVIETTNKLAAHAKGLLERLKKESTERKKEKGTPLSEIRIRDNMCATLTKKFMDSMKDYQKAQQKYKADMKNKVKRQVQIVKPDASEAEIDAVMRSGDTGSIYKSAILQGGAAESITDVFLHCQDKYRDVLKLEQSVAELHQMFLDLALLVEQQGELLDQIDHQVRSAANYVEQGNQEMTKAIKYQKAHRKKMCCLLGVGVAILLAIVVIALVLKKASS